MTTYSDKSSNSGGIPRNAGVIKRKSSFIAMHEILFKDYKEYVIKYYQQKLKANELSTRLAHPTSASLKKECMVVYETRYQKRDEAALRTFFEYTGDQQSMLQAIDRFDNDRFKPLVNFLKSNTSDTDPKNLELLAWLIGLESRPYIRGKDFRIPGLLKADGSEEPTLLPEEDSTKGTVFPKMIVRPAKPIQGKSRILRETVFIFIILILLFVSGFLIFNVADRSNSKALQNDEDCMYWAGDHYEQVPCKKKFGDTLVIALDPEKLSTFRKITRPDTITKKSLGNIYYVKFNGDREYFTADGRHPVDRKLHLKPITDYIIDRYIEPLRNKQ